MNTRRIELVGGLLLVAAAVLALGFANSPWAGVYDRLLDARFEVRLDDAALSKPLLLWINDGLMAVFFLLVGLELKRELLEGELAAPRKLVLPVAAALGGVAVPVGLYLACNAGHEQRVEGWAIPAATDIAFALGMLALLGDRIPPTLRTFLLSLAVIDDLIAIVIVAIYYTDRISWTAQGVALGVFAVLVLLNRLRVTRYGVYLWIGLVFWLCVLESGVHATLAGVMVGLVIPRRPRDLAGQRPLVHLERVIRPWVGFVVLPLFAFFNAGVDVRGFELASLDDPVTYGIALGLVVGKPLGVFGVTWCMLRAGLAARPDGASDRALLGASLLAGIGFTMSLFIGVLAFEDEPRGFSVPIRIGVLGGSLVSALAGLALLRSTAAAES